MPDVPLALPGPLDGWNVRALGLYCVAGFASGVALDSCGFVEPISVDMSLLGGLLFEAGPW